MNSDPPPQHQLGWWCIHAAINSSSLEDYIGCKASTGTDDDGVNVSWWDRPPVGIFTWFATHGTALSRANSLTSGGNKGAAARFMEHPPDTAASDSPDESISLRISTSIPKHHNNQHELLELTASFSSSSSKIVTKYLSVSRRVRSARRQGDKTRFVAAICQNNCGGVSPNVLGVFYFDSGLHGNFNLSTCCGRNTLCYGRGPSHPGDFEGTRIIGGSTEVVKTCPTARGFGIAAGATDGPRAFDFIQGDDRANPFWKLIHDGLNTPGKKQMLAANGMQMCRLHCPIQLLVEHTRKVQFSLGQLVVFNVPVEVTTRDGRRHREDESKAVGQPEADSGGSREPDATVVNTDNFKLVHSELGGKVVCEDADVVDATADIDSAALSFKQE
ncbi:hypothetical protein Nepgr_031692 [Nepenthes gracilis]|uniref:Neutral ceramidase n=1 Tax=Nepenthes gracilis TaxID=150966 RepID=A0AAD3Y7B2_NEPGR|nr:hypothetical protein Nepgr_031692 [Nepenthes gracilis]